MRAVSRFLAYGVYCGIDHTCWLLIQLMAGPQLMALARQRPWRRWQRQLPPGRQQLWKGRITWLLRRRCRRAGWGSTCLSRSLSGRLLLDLVGVANELHLGMSKFSDGRKVPHAWLRDPESGRLFTPGISPTAGIALTHF